MRTYTVIFPITGTASCQVEAENEEAAIEKAWSVESELDTWEQHKEIVRGNVFYGEQNEIEVIDEGEVE